MDTRSATVSRVAARLLFLASAAFVLWRNTQVGALVDISWILNNATRIALGDVPYRDFPLAQAPGEFLIQALLIRLFGANYLVPIFYASLCGGAATVLAYLVARRLLSGSVPAPERLAAIITLPLIPLGIYAIVPNPFYDPDAGLAVLGTIALLMAARERRNALPFLAAGAVAVVPLAFKQNIGAPFLVSLFAILTLEAWRDPARRRELGWTALGTVTAVAVGLALMQVFVGIDAYLRGTVAFALSGRGLALERIGDFGQPHVLFAGAVLAVVGIAAPRLSAPARALFAVAAVVVLAITLAPSIIGGPPVWFPPLLVAAAALGVVRAWREGPRLEVLLPLVLLVTTLGTVESRSLTASTYGIFPLLSLAIACLVRDLGQMAPRPARLAPYAGTIAALVLTGFGLVYTLENVRLLFVDVNAPGPVERSTFPTLTGLSARGPYIADLDAILFWVRDHVPPGDSFVFLPGEDPVYYALLRKPALPSVFFYFGDVATPYTPEEVARIADERGLRWVIVKDRLQQVEVPQLEPDLVARLTARATLVETVGAYRVYRR